MTKKTTTPKTPEKVTRKRAAKKPAHKPALLQAEANKASALHRSWFVAGGRPALLWVSAIGWMMQFVVNPIFEMFTGKTFAMPVEQMVWLTGSVLGIYGTLRTVEKMKGKG
ncbi:MAG: hypothetical protein CMF62_09585 [Magnetococcales bacterium]|nr:hypothetical protein [Magnetococcales bacterium]|tara:strand:+ start:373777 stop:374109 length:333 start_codon:yes stop_codon:yes gene_type:complete